MKYLNREKPNQKRFPQHKQREFLHHDVQPLSTTKKALNWKKLVYTNNVKPEGLEL
jgi:hypothetical protein